MALKKDAELVAICSSCRRSGKGLGNLLSNLHAHGLRICKTVVVITGIQRRAKVKKCFAGRQTDGRSGGVYQRRGLLLRGLLVTGLCIAGTGKQERSCKDAENG